MNGRAETRQVQVLRRSGDLAAIASSLDAGEVVIVYPSGRVASGVQSRQVELTDQTSLDFDQRAVGSCRANA
jgi:hypothetical protein